jgi:predicted nucleotide-binding protein
LTQDLGVTVLDWAEFKPGRTILDEIREAAFRCTGAIFLFTRDDEASDPGPTGKALPRDNVVFEAGYFSSLKTKHNVLIILEDGTKMPADLGGDIYSSLKTRSAVPSIKSDLAKFIDAL